MKKVKTVNGMIIAKDNDGNYYVWTKENWEYRSLWNYSEYESYNLYVAIEFAKDYNNN
jgi:hypothetical protein